MGEVIHRTEIRLFVIGEIHVRLTAGDDERVISGGGEYRIEARLSFDDVFFEKRVQAHGRHCAKGRRQRQLEAGKAGRADDARPATGVTA